MKQRKCCLCGAEIPKKSKDELMTLGYSACRIGRITEKWHYFCNKHTTKEKTDFMGKKLLKGDKREQIIKEILDSKDRIEKIDNPDFEVCRKMNPNGKREFDCKHCPVIMKGRCNLGETLTITHHKTSKELLEEATKRVDEWARRDERKNILKKIEMEFGDGWNSIRIVGIGADTWKKFKKEVSGKI